MVVLIVVFFLVLVLLLEEGSDGLVLQLHLFHTFADVVPLAAHPRLDEVGEISLGHSVPFLPQELKKVNNVVSSCLFQDQSLHLSLSLIYSQSVFALDLLVTLQLYLFQLSCESFPLLIQEIDDFGFYKSLVVLFGGGFPEQVHQVALGHFVCDVLKSFQKGLFVPIVAMNLFVQFTLEGNCNFA